MLVSDVTVWYLSGQIEENGTNRRVPINTLPFRIGRRADLSLALPNSSVSNWHAEITLEGDMLVVRDLQSTNGTYVNGIRVAEMSPLRDGDLVQFANLAFRVGRSDTHNESQTVQADACDRALALVQFDKLISDRAVLAFFPPIVSMEDQQTVGYEVLGRSRLFGLKNPAAMFEAASQLDVEAELSRLFRWEGLHASTAFPGLPHLFLNTHPVELQNRERLALSLREVREVYPVQSLTLEIHEGGVTDSSEMEQLRAALSELNIGLAYDDFGAGQARLVELVEVRPDYLKFDMKLVQGIHKASAQRQQMLESLVRMARELGIQTVAEGIETEADLLACRQIGFDLAQGFYCGRPALVSTFGPI